MLLHVERERLARAALVRDDFRHGALEIVDDLLLAEAERELVRDLEEVAYDLLVVAVERAQRETELLRDIDDVVDVARIDEPWQMEYDRCAQARAEVRRTRCEIAHLLVEREVELSFDGVIDSGSERIGLLEIEPRAHALDAQMILLVDEQAHARVIGEEGHAVLRVLHKILRDETLVDEHLPLQLRELVHRVAAKMPVRRVRHGRNRAVCELQHRRELLEIRPIRERDLAKIPREPDAAREYDIALRCLAREPWQAVRVENILRDRIILRHLPHPLPPA